MSRRILAVVADPAATDVRQLFATRFTPAELTVTGSLPPDVSEYDLGVLWNYPHIVRGLERHDNVAVCHASALPQDRGMAPIYHTVANERERVTLTVIRPTDALDAGPILAQASFPNRPEYTAPLVRGWLARISVEILDALSQDGRIRRMRGRPQAGDANTNRRRRPADNQVDLERSLASMVPHLRACEPNHPAFFDYQGVRYIIEVRPAVEPDFPAVEIVYND